MLSLFQSNRLEKLADALAELLRNEPGLPLRPRPVLVSSPGMGTWLQIRLAESLGIAAGLEFPLPVRWLWRQYRTLVGELPEKSRWDKGPLSWVLWERLDEALADPACASLRRYLDGGDALRRYRLCRRIADLFDQYQVYRPDWLTAWSAGRGPFEVPEAQAWQPALWRRLQHWVPGDAARRSVLFDVGHWTPLWRAAEAGLLPERLVLFATGNLSAPFLDLLELFATRIPVHLFLLNPSADYWADLRGRRERPGEMPDNDTEDPFGEEAGNPLLASLGHQGRAQWHLLLSRLETLQEGDRNLFEAPPRHRLLGAIQADIFELRDGTVAPAPLPDANVSLHCCHSAMREVEVLHDRLREMFAQDPTLEPRDVVVMVPDIEPYAPLVEAVFGQAEHAAIPWAVADRSLVDEVPLVRVLLTLLRPALCRFTANEVLDLLELDAVRARHGFEADDLPLLRSWIRESGIRWGLDGDHRARLGFPPIKQNTWQHGMERLMLAVAAGEDPHSWGETLSLAGIRDGHADLAGRLAALVEALRRYTSTLATGRTAAQWRTLLLELLDELFEVTDQDGLHLEQVRSAINGLVRDQELGGCSSPVDVEVVHAVLADELSGNGTSQRFLAGAVNFCTLMPMRTVPFRVVCLLGMNEADYPHREHPAGYDLMIQRPRVGDRSRRSEDRYLFLEALLAARQTFYVSWTGRDIHTNDPLPPSVVVADLIDYIDRAFVGPDGNPPTRTLLCEHALQPFSARNFTRGRPAERSHSLLWYRVATAVSPPPETAPLPPATLPDVLGIDTLARFLCDPAAGFLQERFRARLGAEDDDIEDDEPLAFTALERWQLRSETAGERLRGEPGLSLAERWRREGRLPPGEAGRRELEAARHQAEAFAQRVATSWPGSAASLPVALQLGETRLQAVIPDHGDSGWYFWSASRLFDRVAVKSPWNEWPMRPERVLRAWLRHLMLNTQTLPERARCGHGWYEDVRLAFPALPAECASAALASLVDLYREAVSAPLPCLPRSGWLAANGFDATAAFAEEAQATPARRRLFAVSPDEAALARYGQVLWQVFREHVQVDVHED